MNNKVVYFHIRKDTGVIFYVGIGNGQRPYDTSNRNKIWRSITSRSDYLVKIVHENVSWDEACKLEEHYIHEFGRIDLNTGTLANMTSGGDGVSSMIISDEHRKKTSETIKNKIKNGEWITPMLGKKMPITEAVKARFKKMSETYSPSEEHRQILSEKLKGDGNGMWGKEPWNKGVELSDEHRQKLKDNHVGMSGKKHSLETRIKQSKSNSNKKLNYDDVIFIRNNHKRNDSNYGTKPLSLKFGVSESAIKNIVSRKSWKFI